jgi:hypothetical protein
MLLRERKRPLPVACAAVAAAAFFFLASNFQVWLMGHGTAYPKTLAGLLACYIAGIPFAWNTLFGNLLFSGLLFGGVELSSATAGRASVSLLDRSTT